MKNLIRMGLGMLSAAALMVSCSDELGQGNEAGSGRINPDIRLNTETIKARSASRADDEAQAIPVEVSDLALRLSATDSDQVWNWERIGLFDTEKQFKVGNYLLEAYYGDPAEQGFDKPAYYGSQTISVKDGEVTRPSVTATLANSIVVLEYTEQFRNYMQSWSAEINGIEYAQDQTADLYVTPGDLDINVTFTKPNGLGATINLDPIEVKAQFKYIVTVDITNGAGEAQLSISFDENMATESINIDLSDKLLSTPAPQVTTKGFTSGTDIEAVAGMVPDMDLSMNIVALAGLKSVTLHTESKSLIAQGWPEDIDLMAADGAMQQKLTEMGLKVLGLWKTPGEMAVVDFSGVIKNIRPVNGDFSNVFTLVVKDKLMRSDAEPSVLSIRIEDVAMQLAKEDEYYIPGEDINVRLSYNGADVAKNIKFQYQDPSWGNDVWRDIEIKKVSPVSRAMSDYIVTLKTPEDGAKLTLRALYGNNISNVLVVETVDLDLTVTMTENNVFSNRAYFTVKENSGQKLPATDKWQIKIKGGSYADYTRVSHSTEGDFLKITGLTPGTAYAVKAVIYGSESNAISFNTEAATALPNGNMETWYKVAGKTQYWWIDYPGADANTVWGTMNLLTTSEGGSSGAPGCGYCAKSGTTPVSENGGTVALIQTVGWGKGNTAWLNRVNGTTGGLAGGACQHFTPGELYLGHYDANSQSAVYDGYAMNSRPSALKFDYKYVPKNSADWGTAEIRVLAADGTVIASKNVNLTAIADYTSTTLNLGYTPTSKKAAKVLVMFKSTGNPDCLAINNNNMDSPTSSSVTTSTGYIGSKLYVDNIQLIY